MIIPSAYFAPLSATKIEKKFYNIDPRSRCSRNWEAPRRVIQTRPPCHSARKERPPWTDKLFWYQSYLTLIIPQWRCDQSKLERFYPASPFYPTTMFSLIKDTSLPKVLYSGRLLLTRETGERSSLSSRSVIDEKKFNHFGPRMTATGVGSFFTMMLAACVPGKNVIKLSLRCHCTSGRIG